MAVWLAAPSETVLGSQSVSWSGSISAGSGVVISIGRGDGSIVGGSGTSSAVSSIGDQRVGSGVVGGGKGFVLGEGAGGSGEDAVGPKLGDRVDAIGAGSGAGLLGGELIGLVDANVNVQILSSRSASQELTS